MSEIVSLSAAGAAATRAALERCLAAGGVAIFPADGLYGLACDPLSSAAIERIQRIKGRGHRKPSAVLYFSPLAMRELLDGLGARSREALAALLPGPVTLIIANPEHRYPLACREDLERLGVRLIAGPLAGVRCPVFQTSANLSGEPAPADFASIASELIDAVDLAIDGGALSGLPSTVIDITAIDADGCWQVLRPGGLSAGDLAAAMAKLSPPG